MVFRTKEGYQEGKGSKTAGSSGSQERDPRRGVGRRLEPSLLPGMSGVYELERLRWDRLTLFLRQEGSRGVDALELPGGTETS